MSTETVLFEIADERRRQDAKWGEQNWPDGTGGLSLDAASEAAKIACRRAADAGAVTWRDIMAEEWAEALAERAPSRLRAELIQVAAVAVNWIEAIDRRG